MTAPTLGLVFPPADDPLLDETLHILSKWITPRHAKRGDEVAAWFVTDRTTPDLVGVGPTIVWARSASTTWTGAADAVYALPGLVGRAAEDDRHVTIPDPGCDAASVAFTPPLVRRRWRQRLGLPDGMLVDLDAGERTSASQPTRATQLMVGAVATGRGDVVLAALGSGLPLVTDAGTHAMLGLGDAAVVADPDGFAETAADVARSEQWMAALAWRGRVLVEQRFDIGGAAWRLLRACLGEAAMPDETHGVSSLLGELWTPPRTALDIAHAIGG